MSLMLQGCNFMDNDGSAKNDDFAFGLGLLGVVIIVSAIWGEKTNSMLALIGIALLFA
ncbi:MAG: hypothetical protein Q8P82_01850 [bacterium]|nr:hypothetical protein [bacterium]